jgi:hypothetical protein
MIDTSRREGADGDEKNRVFVKCTCIKNSEQRNRVRRCMLMSVVRGWKCENKTREKRRAK